MPSVRRRGLSASQIKTPSLSPGICYIMDNESRVPHPNTTEDPSSDSWVCSPQTEAGVTPADATGTVLSEKIVGIKRGVMYPYVEVT